MVRINLLPVRVSKKKEAGKQQLVLFAVLLVGGVVGNYLWSGSRTSELTGKEQRVARTRADIAQLDKIIGEVKSLRTQQQELKDKLDVLEKLKQGRTGPVRMLDELASITPKRLWLKKLDEKSGKVVFEGTASSIDDVSTFMTALKGSRSFGDVELKRTAARVESGYRVVDFTIAASARYAPPPAPSGPGGTAKAGG
ncbi:MAG TPA: PilN domain-containing protein [Anaeromyxobacter sp.]|nr:PilN domain-containing protein [Anaeromyxobacter sp.]